MNKKKITGSILAIFGIILLISIICVLRKFMIIKGLEKNLKKYVTSTNYHIKFIRKENGKETIYNYYEKDNKSAYVVEFPDKKMSVYDNGERKDLFFETQDKKIAHLNANFVGMPKLIDYFFCDIENDWQLFILSTKTKIKKSEYKGKKCYIIEGFSYNDDMCIDKETGLKLTIVGENYETHIEYEFNNVNDSIFVEPNISEYKLEG